MHLKLICVVQKSGEELVHPIFVLEPKWAT